MLKRSLLSAGVLLIMLGTELWPVTSLAQVQGVMACLLPRLHRRSETGLSSYLLIFR